MTTAQEIKFISKDSLSAPTGSSLAILPNFTLHPSLCLMLNRVVFRAEATPLQFLWDLFQCILLTRFDQLFISYSLCLHSESAPKQLNHENITKYKSFLLLLCHSDSLSKLSHLFFLFSLHLPFVLLSLIVSLSFSPSYTNTTLINCGNGNYIEPTGKFHFHLHLDYTIFHSYQSMVQDQCVHGFTHMQTQLIMVFLYSHWGMYCMHTGWAHMLTLKRTHTKPLQMHDAHKQRAQ